MVSELIGPEKVGSIERVGELESNKEGMLLAWQYDSLYGDTRNGPYPSFVVAQKLMESASFTRTPTRNKSPSFRRFSQKYPQISEFVDDALFSVSHEKSLLSLLIQAFQCQL